MRSVKGIDISFEPCKQVLAGWLIGIIKACSTGKECKLLGQTGFSRQLPLSTFGQMQSRRLSSVLVASTPVSLCGPHWQHGFKNLPHPPPPLLLLHLHQLACVRRTAIGWASTWLHIKARLNPPAHLFLTLPLPVHLPVQLHLVGRLKAPLAGPHSSPHRIPQRLLLGICTTDRYTTMLNSSPSAFSGANPQDATFSLHYWEWHIENLFPETSI